MNGGIFGRTPRRSVAIVAFASVCALAAASCRTASSEADKATSDTRLLGSFRAERNGWIYVHTQGKPGQLGFQHGYWLEPEIIDLLRVVKPLLQHLTGRD